MRIHWFRRDLRLSDNPALNEAAAAGPVAGVFVVDPRLWDSAGPHRLAYLSASLQSLDEQLEGHLMIRHGDPAVEIPRLAKELSAVAVHAAEDFAPYGRTRDAAVARTLEAAGVELHLTGSPYAVSPGRVRKPDGTPYRVYTPFYKAWLAHGWRRPAPPASVEWVEVSPRRSGRELRLELPPLPDVELSLPAGEPVARDVWVEYRAARLDGYGRDRNRPDLDRTSRLSHHLRWGEIHPRTLLADLGDESGHEVFGKELAWREFYADVLFHQPASARENLNPINVAHDTGPVAEQRFEAWSQGRTGYPIVDAGMRQMRAEGWMHNRVRMITASFLVKDLHLPWWLGAREFMRWLVDGDLASNSHGWQWTAGTGTDAAPYFRVFNPTAQGQRFDPDGDYVRRWIPELAHIHGQAVHEPWALLDGLAHGYPERIVDHAAERNEALARYEAGRGAPYPTA